MFQTEILEKNKILFFFVENFSRKLFILQDNVQKVR